MATDPARSDVAAITGRNALGLVIAAVLLLVVAGLLLWHRHGAAVFGDTVAAALAWCF